jgi:hypothetical protein
MTPKERRDRLFRKSRPRARKLVIMDGDKYSRDIGILWSAYKAGSFTIEAGLSQEDFMVEIEKTLGGFKEVWVIDDDTKVFSSGRGPVGMIGANASGLIIEPRFVFFKWATCRNVLKATVAFLQMIKRSVDTGIVLVRTPKERRVIAEHMKEYDLLFFLGKSAENEYLYSGRGRGSSI